MAHSVSTGCKLYYNTGTYGTPSYTAMEGVTSDTLNVSVSLRETTDKDDNDWATYLTGIRTWSIDFVARGDTGNSAQDQFIDDIIGASAVTLSKVEWKTFDSNKYSGDVFATSLSISAELTGVIEISGTLTGTGALTQAAA